MKLLATNQDLPKLSDIFQVYPDLVNMRVKKNEKNDGKADEKEEFEDFNLFNCKTLIQIACEHATDNEGEHPEILKLFLSQKNIYMPLRYLYYLHGRWCDDNAPFVELVEILIKHNPMFIHESDGKGNLPLHVACKFGDVKTVKLLLQQPTIVVNATNINGKTALHKAAQNEKAETVEMLRNHPGIDVNIKDRFERTPLHYFCDRYYSDSTAEMIKAVFEISNFDVDAIDVYKKSASNYTENDSVKSMLSSYKRKCKENYFYTSTVLLTYTVI